MKMDGFTFKAKAPDGKVIEHSVPGVENGIVGVITNHSWLDNPTFRGMRQSLMRSFQQIYVLDLHGNTKKKEHTPDGSKDENVFDIEQGVAISLLIKCPGIERGVWRGDLWGKRLEKYRVLAGSALKDMELTEVEPSSDLYLFSREDVALRREYDPNWKLTDMYPINVLGFQSHRDGFAFGFSKVELKDRISRFLSSRAGDKELADAFFTPPASETEEARQKRIQAVSALRERIRKVENFEADLTKTSYFSFDDRWCFYNAAAVDRPRKELLQHVYGRDNICLNVVRQTKQRDWRHALVSVLPTTPLFIETKDGSYVFPISLYEKNRDENDAGKQRFENLSPEFRKFMDSHYEHHYTPEEILGYVYAVLHATSYRTRYAEFLRIDFPRIPFPESKAEFDALSKLGWALVQAHLLRKLPRTGLAAYHGKGEHEVEAVRYDRKDEALWINKTQCFEPVPQAVWDFQIGGYQVLDKYLKSRKGRTLELDEINHVAAVADALAFTIEQMAKIDQAYRATFPERG